MVSMHVVTNKQKGCPNRNVFRSFFEGIVWSQGKRGEQEWQSRLWM